MKTVILAAGLGSRLRPITDKVPKCMVPVNGIRIIDKQIDNLLKNGVTEIYVVSGYLHEVLDSHLKANYPMVQIVHNERYNETNNMYSLYMTEQYVKGEDFLLMNADVYFDSNIIAGMLEGEGSKIACNYSQYIEESMKITCADNKRVTKNVGQDVGQDVTQTDGNVAQNVGQDGARAKKKNRYVQVLNGLLTHRRMPLREVAKIIGVSERTINRDLKDLRRTYRIEWIGGPWKGRWEIERL